MKPATLSHISECRAAPELAVFTAGRGLCPMGTERGAAGTMPPSRLAYDYVRIWEHCRAGRLKAIGIANFNGCCFHSRLGMQIAKRMAGICIGNRPRVQKHSGFSAQPLRIARRRLNTASGAVRSSIGMPPSAVSAQSLWA
jgi:hypothetical protein